MSRLFAILMLGLLSAPLFAYEELAGQEAPQFDAKTCVNAPEQTSLNDCLGGVILLKYWGPA